MQSLKWPHVCYRFALSDMLHLNLLKIYIFTCKLSHIFTVRNCVPLAKTVALWPEFVPICDKNRQDLWKLLIDNYTKKNHA